MIFKAVFSVEDNTGQVHLTRSKSELQSDESEKRLQIMFLDIGFWLTLRKKMAENNPPNKKNDQNGGKRPDQKKPNNNDKFEWRKAARTLTMWILIVIVAWILFSRLNLTEQPEIEKSYSQYQKLLENGQIDAAEIIDREFHGRLKDGTGIVTTLPFINKEMLAEWDSLKIDYQFREKSVSWVQVLITNILPWVIIIGIWLYIMRRMQGGGPKGIFSFGKSRAKLMMQSKTRITFSDVAGCEEAKEELREVIDFLRDPKKFSRLGGRIPKGALLLGPPGTGKTLLARAIAGEAGVPFFSMSGADFVEMFVGVGASRVRDLFEQGKKNAPCIIFIDEIDAVGRHRGAGLGGGHDEREQTLNQLLVEMDGFESNEGVILIAATNRPDVLDPALTRPGRFDRQIIVDRPDVRGRDGILKVHTRKLPLAPDVRLDVLAKGTPGLSGADLSNLVNEAALLAARRNVSMVYMEDMENAKDKVMMGAERKSMLISNEEKKQTAYHEAGHVLVAKLTPGTDPVHKVTIIPRGRALGVTHYLPLDERHNYSRSYLKQNLVHLLGGRAAEKIIFNELSTGAGNDIQRATEIARKMVCEWGMSEKLGPVSLGNQNDEVFLGRDYHQQRNYSEKTAQEIDSEIQKIVSSAEQRAEKLLRENLPKLHAISESLLEREILDGSEIDVLIKGGKLTPLKQKKAIKQAQEKERKAKTTADKSSSRRRKPSGSEAQQPRAARKSVKKDPKSSSGSESRKRALRENGVVSSRDPGNRRPSQRELAKMDVKESAEKSEEGKDDGRKTPSRRPRRTPARRRPVQKRAKETQSSGTKRRTARSSSSSRKPPEDKKSGAAQKDSDSSKDQKDRGESKEIDF